MNKVNGQYNTFVNGKLTGESTIEFLAAHWQDAVKIALGERLYQRGTILYTKNSENLTNATILDALECGISPANSQYFILTDIGNFVTLSLTELIANYKTPKMKRVGVGDLK